VGLTVEEVERRLILSTLENVSDNRTRAAEMLGISEIMVTITHTDTTALVMAIAMGEHD